MLKYFLSQGPYSLNDFTSRRINFKLQSGLCWLVKASPALGKSIPVDGLPIWLLVITLRCYCFLTSLVFIGLSIAENTNINSFNIYLTLKLSKHLQIHFIRFHTHPARQQDKLSLYAFRHANFPGLPNAILETLEYMPIENRGGYLVHCCILISWNRYTHIYLLTKEQIFIRIKYKY